MPNSLIYIINHYDTTAAVPLLIFICDKTRFERIILIRHRDRQTVGLSLSIKYRV